MSIINKIKKWTKLYFAQFSLKKLENRRTDKKEGVVIIKLDAIGDFVIWLDSAKEYRNLYPFECLTLVCNSACVPLAESTQYFHEIIPVKIRDFESDKEYQTSIKENLKSRQFGILIQASYSRTIHMDIIAASIPANQKIAFFSDESKSNLSRYVVSRRRKKILDNIYDRLIKTSDKPLMELKRNEEFIQKLGNRDFLSSLPLLPIKTDIAIPEKTYFVVVPGASTKTKMWREENFASVIDFVVEKTGWVALICGSKEEAYLFDRIYGHTRNKDFIENYFGKTSILELIEVIRGSKLVISNDTSGIHFAAATNARAVCILGEYNYGRFLPYIADKVCNMGICSANMKCKNCASKKMSLKCKIHMMFSGRYLCLDKVSVHEVQKKIMEII